MNKKVLGWTAALSALAFSIPMFSSAAVGSAPVITHTPRMTAKSTTVSPNLTSGFGWSSPNWAGYALTGSTYSDITGTWNVPTVSASSSATYSSFWVGIDGYNNSYQIQVGTEANYYSGAAHYGAWWEILPAAQTMINMSIKPGDIMYAHLHNNGNGTWLINIQDQTTSASFSTTQSYSGPATSAEWIASISNGQTMAHISTITMDPGTVNGGNPHLVQTNGGYMTNSLGSTIVSVSAPDSDTDGFNVSYGSGTPAPPQS